MKLQTMHRALLTFPLFSAIATAIFTSPVQAQSCAGFFQRPVNKERLNTIAASVGIVNSSDISRVENAFEAFALGTISGIPLTPAVQPNKNPEKKFPSPARDVATNGKFKNVEPDGLLPLIVIRGVDVRTYPNSVFYEVKAVSNTHLPPKYNDAQILGFIDAARRSTDAGKAGQRPGELPEIPGVVFLTTSNVAPLSEDTRAIAYAAGVGLLHSIVCESGIPGATSGNLQLGPALLLNPGIYIGTGVAPLNIGLGNRSLLQNFRVNQ